MDSNLYSQHLELMQGFEDWYQSFQFVRAIYGADNPHYDKTLALEEAYKAGFVAAIAMMVGYQDDGVSAPSM